VTVGTTATARPSLVAARGQVLRRAGDWLPAVVVFIGFIVGWQLLVVGLEIERFVLPAPLAIGEAFVTYFDEILAAGLYTGWEAVGGLLIGVAAGVATALIAGRWVAMRESLLPFAIVFNSVPIIAFAPIMNNWFGVANPMSKMAIAAILTYFPVMINTVRGLTLIDHSALELMRSTAATEMQVLRKVRIPNALPFFFTALRVATTLATIGAIVGEYFGAPRASLGQYIAQHAAYFNFERSWAAIIVAAGIGITLYVAALLIERIVMPWHASFRTNEL
jgi:NitT/TauT family transport system permease protein